MSSSYKALLQSLDDDVVRGLGRQIKLKNERYANRRKTCCSRCCASAFTRWLCVLLCLAVGLAASVAIPMVIVLPVDSQWHYRHWFHNWRYFASNGSNFTEDFRGNGTRFETEAEGTVSGGNGTRAATFFEETARQWRQMTEWLKHRYEETPKVPLLVGLAIPLAGFIAIASVVIYRKMKRRQRRRALGKLVTDLQSGKTLLASDSDSDED